MILLVLTVAGWWAVPADRTGAPPAPAATGPGTPYQYTATDLPTGGLAAATTLIVAGLILGAVIVGRIFYSPSRKRR